MMLSRTIFNVMRRKICENTRTLYRLRNASNFHSLCNVSFVNSFSVQRNPNPIIFSRFKSKRKTLKHRDEDDDQDEVDISDVDDYLMSDTSKTIEKLVPSLRLDTIAKAAFGISRAKVDKEFYNSNIRVNGKRQLKKSAMVDVEDEIDLIVGRSLNNSDFLVVHRCVMSSIKPSDNGIHVKLIRNKGLLIEDYDDPWNGVKD